MNHQALLFDLGNVLVDFSFDQLLGQMAAMTHKSPEEIQDFFFQSGLEMRFELGLISPEEFYHCVVQGLSFRGDFHHFAELWNNIFTENPKAVPLLKRLGKRYPLVIVSNTNELHFEHVRKSCPVLKQAAHHIVSYEVRSRKPDRKIFDCALETVKVRPEEALFVDDLEPNIVGAQALGINSIHFRDMDQLERDLQRLKIL